MSEGSNAVWSALANEFGAIDIREGFDSNMQEILLDFKAEGRDFRVRVTHEYDTDYASEQLKVNLQSLGRVLRASKNGTARVMTAGIQEVA